MGREGLLDGVSDDVRAELDSLRAETGAFRTRTLDHVAFLEGSMAKLYDLSDNGDIAAIEDGE